MKFYLFFAMQHGGLGVMRLCHAGLSDCDCLFCRSFQRNSHGGHQLTADLMKNLQTKLLKAEE